VEQSRLILLIPACVPDFQSVPKNPSVVEVAAAAPPAVQAAVNCSSFLILKYPRAGSCRGYFFAFSPSDENIPGKGKSWGKNVVRQFSFTHKSTILLMYLSSVICHLPFLTDKASELTISNSCKS